MLSLVCGPFHPQLERALVDDLLAVKAEDPLAPVLVVVPSDTLRRRVTGLLARGRGRTLLHLSILTFHGLSRRLVEEATGRRHPPLTGDDAYEEATRLALDRGAGGPFAGAADTHGGCAALWQTLRDLKDAKISPEALSDAVADGAFPADRAMRLAALAALYREVSAVSRTAGWVDYTDLDSAAADSASQSTYLRAQRLIVYYGFYDLTQAQYDVLRAVTAHAADTAVYFPMASGDPAWAFADRFFQRYLVGLSTRPLRVLDESAPAGQAAVVACSGAGDEVVTCAKEILRLVEEEGFAFEEIGVVARSLDPYSDIVAREFRRHHIPFVTTAQRGLVRFPLAQAVVRLLRIAEGAPTREDILDVLSSPWCRVERVCPGAAAAPAVWDELARSIGVIRGYEAWERLAALSGPDDSCAAASRTRGDHAAVLLQLVHALRAACAALPDAASGAVHAKAWGALLESLLGLSASPGREEDDDHQPGDEEAVSRALAASFEAPARLDAVRPTMTRQAFIEFVRRRIEATALPMSDGRGRGVLVTDATAGRGVGFRALFVLGLNDGVFPRVVREDAFLRDHDRRLIETTLGYKIPEKLDGYEEERLLFSALVQAGRERLVLVHQRADESGRSLAPSWYLTAWRQGVEGTTVVEVPRRTREKPGVPPFDRLERYTPREAAVMAALLDADAGRVTDQRTAAFLRRAERLRRAVDAWGSSLSVFDGDLDPPRERIEEFRALGYTATGLNAYAQCPWRFFLADVLEIMPPADAQDRVGPTARDWGLLAHEALARAARAGDESIDAIWREVCARHAQRHGIGYPLAWGLAVERLGRVLAEVLADDRAESARSGYAPLDAEVTLQGALEGEREIPIRGRLDRVDAGPDGRLRVIDWKLRWTRSRDRRADPVAAALRGQSLQPPLYAALARGYAATRRGGTPEAPIDVAVYTVQPRAEDTAIDRARYEPDAETSGRIRSTIDLLVGGIERGLFPMIPDAYCSWCQLSAACRRRHAPSRARAERDPRAARLTGIRRAALPKATS